jgi:hypothetical protein
VAALFSRSRTFRLSAFARLTGDSAFFGGGIDVLLFETKVHVCWGKHTHTPKTQDICQDISRALRGTPAGQTGPRQCPKTPGAGSRGTALCPRTQRLWTGPPAARHAIGFCRRTTSVAAKTKGHAGTGTGSEKSRYQVGCHFYGPLGTTLLPAQNASWPPRRREVVGRKRKGQLKVGG